jgi:hypothetical protein
MLKSANEKYTKYANQSPKSAKFEIGDQVYVSTLNMKTNRPVKKLDYRKIGPYPITEKINNVAFKVKLPKSIKVHPVFHVSLLEHAKIDKNPAQKHPHPPPIIIDDKLKWEVEEILDSRIYHEELQYLVKWKGWDHTDSSREPEHFVENSQDLIKAFHKKYLKKPKAGSLSSRG